jgi:hypothetical protein
VPAKAQKLNAGSPFVQDLLSSKRKEAKWNCVLLEYLAPNPWLREENGQGNY